MKDTLKQIGITNDFMFGHVMSEPNRCKKFLEQILNIKIDHVKILGHQKSIDLKQNIHGIRLDIYLESSNEIINCEMQQVKNKILAKRSRYYQAQMDTDILERGADYRELKNSIVVFICTFDPFEDDLMIYRFENRCKECPELSLNDGTKIVFINTKGTVGDVTDSFRELVAYFNNAESAVNCKNELVKDIDHAVKEALKDKKWRDAYMTWERYGKDCFEQGQEAGLIKGRAEGWMTGKIESLIELLHEGLISLPDAARHADMSEEEFMIKMQKTSV